jgi:hypothetical protein
MSISRMLASSIPRHPKQKKRMDSQVLWSNWLSPALPLLSTQVNQANAKLCSTISFFLYRDTSKLPITRVIGINISTILDGNQPSIRMGSNRIYAITRILRALSHACLATDNDRNEQPMVTADGDVETKAYFRKYSITIKLSLTLAAQQATSNTSCYISRGIFL